jgi:phage shock protein C
MNDEYQPGPPPAGPTGPRTPDRVLRRSREDRVLGGVSGGLGRYFGVDPILIRLAWVALVLVGGSGVLLYIIAWIIIPEEKAGEHIGTVPTSTTDSAMAMRYLIGGGLIVIGAALLLRLVIPDIEFRFIWPVVLIAVGLIILMKGMRR